MSGPLDDERIQFFLRHRDDIRGWAAIEPDVATAVRQILAATQAEIESRIVAIDAESTTARRDGGRWERIMVRRPAWPEEMGVSVEWETRVDPFGGALPKVGVILLSDAPELGRVRQNVVDLASGNATLHALGYRIPAEHVWPVMRRVPKSRDWWQDSDAWTAGIVDSVVELWPLAAPYVDQALAASGLSGTGGP